MGCKVLPYRTANRLSTRLESLSLHRKSGYVGPPWHIYYSPYKAVYFGSAVMQGLRSRSSQSRVEVPQNGRRPS